jgi:hypothetical protein
MALLPTVIADAGTPLMWAGFLHLTVGNLLIGFLEVAVVRVLFKSRPTTGLFGWIILGNYASCFAGFLAINAWSDWAISRIGGELPVYSLDRIMVIFWVVSFLITLAVEWPFYRLGMRHQGGGAWRSLRGTVVANTVSYALLFAWYWLASAKPTSWGVALCPANQLESIPNARVFYIASNGMDVMQLRLDGSAPTKISRLAAPAPWGALGFAHPVSDGMTELEIQAEYGTPIQKVAEISTVRAATRPTENDNWVFHFGGDDLQKEQPPKWTVWCGNWAGMGIRVSNEHERTGKFIMAVEMPWVSWMSSNATILPNDQLVFQLGEQIMLVDLKRNLAAAVAAGHGPVVVLDGK